jgi:hypothetical protein
VDEDGYHLPCPLILPEDYGLHRIIHLRLEDDQEKQVDLALCPARKH